MWVVGEAKVGDCDMPSLLKKCSAILLKSENISLGSRKRRSPKVYQLRMLVMICDLAGIDLMRVGKSVEAESEPRQFFSTTYKNLHETYN